MAHNALTQIIMKNNIGNIIGFGIIFLIAAGFLGFGVGYLLGGQSAAVLWGKWATLPGGLAGMVYGATRKPV